MDQNKKNLPVAYENYFEEIFDLEIDSSFKIKCIIEQCPSKKKEFSVAKSSTCNIIRHLKVSDTF